jgi:raffinose synthase
VPPQALRRSRLANGQLHRLTTDAPATGWSPLAIAPLARALALCRANAYWFTPRVLGPDFTLSAAEQTVFLLLRTASGEATVVLPLPGPRHRAWLETRDGRLGVAWQRDTPADNAPADPAAADSTSASPAKPASADAATDAPFAFVLSGADPAALPAEAVRLLRPVLGTYRTREEKAPACFLDDFGWCTWDAFYYDVTAADVARGLRTLARGGFAPGFVILDDGWQDASGWSLASTRPNAKFPAGLAPVVRQARTLGVRHFGLWHTLHGYWHGIDPAGPLAQRYRVVTIPQDTTDFKGWPDNFDPAVRHTLHPDDAPAFYRAFYAELAAAGIDFTKVDGQSATPYFAGDRFAPGHAHDAFQWAVQTASAQHLAGGGGIHCMAHSPDILWRLRSTPVFRNSDDFYPKRPFDAQARHLVHNACHAVFTGLFATPDWDMFHSRHPQALFHAAARALSGGPVYVSDKPGHHDFALLRRLVLPGGRVPRFAAPGLPPGPRLFDDPLRTPVPLALANHGGVASALALFNCRIEPASSPVSTRWSPAELPGLAGRDFIAHAPLTGETVPLRRTQKLPATLAAAGDVQVWTVAPVIGGVLAPLGLEGYLAAAATVARAEAPTPGVVTVELRHPGMHLFWCPRAPRSVCLGDRALRPTRDAATGLLRLRVPGDGPATVVFTFSAARR